MARIVITSRQITYEHARHIRDMHNLLGYKNRGEITVEINHTKPGRADLQVDFCLSASRACQEDLDHFIEQTIKYLLLTHPEAKVSKTLTLHK